MEVRKLISVARGEEPADLVLANAQVVNTFTGEIERANVAICGERIAGVGDYHKASEIIDLGGEYIAPAFIDGHTHIESSMLDLGEYALAVVQHGTLGVVTDLHEIASVLGLNGMKYVMRRARELPLDVFLMVPSCVPATHLETSGAKLGINEVRKALGWERAVGLGEVMNFPGVLAGDEEILAKIASAKGKLVDGHAPGLKGKELGAYIGAGIGSDHESTTLEEAREKLKRGMWVMIREGSSEKNLEAILPLVNDKTYHRCFFVVDDRSCLDLLQDGDVDGVVAKAIKLGLDPVRAIQMATINPATYFRLDGLGAIAPGYFANLIVIPHFSPMKIDMVFYRGEMVMRRGNPLFSAERAKGGELRRTVNIKPFGIEALKIPAQNWHYPIIELVPGQIITKKLAVEAKVEDAVVVSDIEKDILKLVVVERHHATGNIGRGLVKGFGLRRGVLASSIAHDSHNIVCVGVDDQDIYTAVKEIERLEGGLVVAAGGQVLGSLPLPIAGLLSDEPLGEVVSKLGELERLSSDLGCRLSSPFSTLSFLALPVIPELRLTDKGLVDVEAFKLL
jgi:adenine deaminase